MPNAAPQSASETDTQHGPNSETAVAVNPFASPAVKESISFDKALCEFLRLHYHVHEPKAREWMHAARTDQQGDSEALRFSRAVHQAENAHWNQLGQFRGHFAVWHADPLYMRAYEAWPDLTMHERYSRLKMALGPVATPFNFAGTLDEAVAALEKFILTGEIPKPPAPSAEIVAACKQNEIEQRAARLEKAFEKPAVVHGPVVVAAQKIAQSGETVVKLTDETPPEDDADDLDDWFPRDDPKVEKPADEKPEHWSQTARFNKALTAIQNKNEASRILKASAFRDFAHNECEVISFKDLPNTPDAEKHSLETIEQSADLKYGPKKDKPMPEKTMENIAPATSLPAKPNDAVAGKAEPQTVADTFVVDPFLSEAKTLMGIPATRIQEFINRKYEAWAYSTTKGKGGKDWTVIDPIAVRQRFDKVFGPHGIGWRILPVPNAASTTITPFTQKTNSGERAMYQVTLSGYYLEYRVRVAGEVEWQRTSAFTDSDDNDDLGYSAGGAFTSLMKQALKMLGGYDHFIVPQKKIA